MFIPFPVRGISTVWLTKIDIQVSIQSLQLEGFLLSGLAAAIERGSVSIQSLQLEGFLLALSTTILAVPHLMFQFSPLID